MSELQPGMLALVTGYKNVAQNLGKIVTLDKFVSAGEIAIHGPVRRDLWVISGNGVGYTFGGNIIIGSIGLSEARHLMPIKPEADPLEIKQHQELHA